MSPTISSSEIRARWSFYYAETPSLKQADTDNKVNALMQKVLVAKRDSIEKAMSNTFDRYSPVFIGGDFFTGAYLLFDGIQKVVPSIQSIGGVVTASSICGVIGGLINIGVGIKCVMAGINEKTDKENANKMIWVGILIIAIGLIMTLGSLAKEIAVFGGIGAFLTANPWFLPVLFFLATLITLKDLAPRFKRNVLDGVDLGSKLQLDKLQEHLKNKEWKEIEKLYGEKSPFHILFQLDKLPELLNGDWKEIKDLYVKDIPFLKDADKDKILSKLNKLQELFRANNWKENEKEEMIATMQKEILTQKMADLQVDVGTEAAVEAFALLFQTRKIVQCWNKHKLVEDRDVQPAKDLITITGKQTEKWNYSLKV